MALEVDSLTLAGAFVVGCLAGAVATIRLARAVIDAVSRARRRLDDD